MNWVCDYSRTIDLLTIICFVQAIGIAALLRRIYQLRQRGNRRVTR